MQLMRGQTAGHGLQVDLSLPRVVACEGRSHNAQAPKHQKRRILHQAATGRDCQSCSDAPSTSVSAFEVAEMHGCTPMVSDKFLMISIPYMAKRIVLNVCRTSERTPHRGGSAGWQQGCWARLQLPVWPVQPLATLQLHRFCPLQAGISHKCPSTSLAGSPLGADLDTILHAMHSPSYTQRFLEVLKTELHAPTMRRSKGSASGGGGAPVQAQAGGGGGSARGAEPQAHATGGRGQVILQDCRERPLH